MKPPLSILCVTKGESHATAFLTEMCALAEACGGQVVLAGDGASGFEMARQAAYAYASNRNGNGRLCAEVIGVQSTGFLESVLERALEPCTGEYVLRLDDDERCSEAMTLWLLDEHYREADHWKFCTANLWGDAQSVITDPPLWPDHHTRLSVRSKAGGRHTPHAAVLTVVASSRQSSTSTTSSWSRATRGGRPRRGITRAWVRCSFRSRCQSRPSTR